MQLFYFIYILGGLIPHAVALQVTPNSPCASFCIDAEGDDVSDPNSSTTTNKDITCYNSKYTTSLAGQKFQRCISCLQDSTFSQGSESDQLWFLYNLRYTFDNCIFGFPNAIGIPSTPCSTSTACGSLEGALTKDGLSPKNPDYSYCDVDGGVITSSSITKCMTCVGASDDQGFLVNYLVALEAGCNQRPKAGEIVSLSDTVFSNTVINAVDPATNSSEDNQPTLPIAAIIGIAVGALVVILAIAGFFFVRHRRQRNRRLLLEGGMSRKSSPRRGHRPASSLSFRCQARLTPRTPAFFPNESDSTVEEEKTDNNPHLALRSHPITHESSASGKSPASQQQQPTTPSFTRPRQAPMPLQSISTKAPAVPDTVHYSTSPRASRFSPHEEPSSTTSTRSTAQLLPLRPYNPAEYGVSSPHIGSSSNGSYTSPISGSTTSPLMSRLWDKQNQDAMAPVWEMPVRETLVTTRPKTAGALERIGVPLSPGKKRISNTGSPVESQEINIIFAGPPSPGARWGRR